MMIMSMPAEAWLVLSALALAFIVGIIALIVIAIGKIARSVDKTPVASTSVRFVAFVIDFTIISLITEIIVSIATQQPSLIVREFISSFLLGIIVLPVVIVGELISYLLYIAFLLAPLAFYYSGNILILVLFGFLYFLFFDGIFGGISIGKKVMRIKSVTRIGRNPLTIKEGIINALGKSFLLLFDLAIGIALPVSSGRDSKQKQIRATQRIADILVVNTRYVGETDSDWLEPTDGDKDEVW
ncbi:MAG: hypothetical protein ACTSUB_07585 [Candidatus Thorarchaeota archaeon]